MLKPHLLFDNDFSKMMMEKNDSRDRLRAALSAVLRREVGDRMLIMEVGIGEAQDVVKLFASNKVYSMVAKDFNGIERYVKIMS